ncbi:MAG TPA: winged helix-turn-helix domain-containing protein, partial [Candidatus Dormibacteraeota bacterium]|nr:winged helix-turn-helix domain-containing protein [Candidatus Dormibacteraeota bacterium]
MTQGRCYEFGPFRLDAGARLLFRQDQRLPLTPKAVEVLLVLVEGQGQPVSREELLHKVWPDAIVEEGSLTSHISLLRKVLGDRPSDQEFIETVSKRGYRFIGRVREVATQAPSASGKIMLAVLPLENLGGREKYDYFSDGVTEEMITQLARLSPDRLGVIARTSAMRYRSTDKSVRQIGRELGVSYVLEGSVRRAGHRVRIAAQLIQVSDETHLWAESYERNLGDILTLQFDVAQAVAKEIQVKLARQEQERLAKVAVVSPQAYEAYLKGRYLLNRRTLEALQKSVQYFKKSIEHDPHYSVAFAGLADSYLTHHDLGHLSPSEATTKAKAAARKALGMDETLAEAHTSLGHAHFHEFDWLAAGRDFKRAIKLNPNYANAHFYYANYLVALGQMNEAIAEARCAQALDPVSLPAGTNLAAILFFAGHYAEAVEEALRVLEIDPTFARAYEDLGRAYEQQGMYAQGIAAFGKAVERS